MLEYHELKYKLIEDYDRYIDYYVNSANSDSQSSYTTKYISLIVYIGDLFAEMFDEDIENYSENMIEIRKI